MMMANIISYKNNVMLAAILSLLLVILFVLLLHIYARWFLGQAHHRGRVVLGPARRLPHQSAAHTTTTTTTYTYDITTTTTKGLDPTVINGIPLFVYGQDESKNNNELECAICLSKFEEKEEGRSLPRCSHAFHVGCIDMWLHSHTTCPICRAQVLPALELDQKDHHKPSSDAHDHDQTVESSSSSSSTVEIVVENQDENVGVRDSSTSDCSLRRMLSWGGSRSENRVHPSLPL